MIEVRLWELVAWPLLAAGFAAHFSGARRAAQVWAGATAAAVVLTWALSEPGSANRARLSEAGELLGWGLAAAIPAAGYALLLRWARRKARERGE